MARPIQLDHHRPKPRRILTREGRWTLDALVLFGGGAATWACVDFLADVIARAWV